MKGFSLPKYKLSRSQRWVRPLHAYSSMLMLFILLFFTLTGLTLNNRQWLPTPQASQEVELALATKFAGITIKATSADLQGQAIWQWLKKDQGLLGVTTKVN